MKYGIWEERSRLELPGKQVSRWNRPLLVLGKVAQAILLAGVGMLICASAVGAVW